MGLREAIADYFNAIGNYLLGQDFDVIVGAKKQDPRAAPDPQQGRRAAQRGSQDRKVDLERATLAEAVEDARRQWVAARKFFDHVIEPELIDYAVFSMGAAEKRYMFLLDEARRRGVEVNPLATSR